MQIDWSDFAAGYASNGNGFVAGGGEATAEDVALLSRAVADAEDGKINREFAGNLLKSMAAGGRMSPEDVSALQKALSAGDGQAVPGEATAGALKPLMPESLDGTLASLTYTEEDFPFWAALNKGRAFNTAEEYNQLLSVGEGEAGFIGEGDLPTEDSSTYKRNVTLIKFLGVTRRVTHVASLVRTAGVDSAIAAETRDGTVHLMRILEEALFFGDSSLVPIQFDGLQKQLIDGGAAVYDMRGGPLTIKILNGMAAHVRKRPNYGRVDTLFCSVGVKSDVVNDQLTYQRARFGEKVNLGLTADVIETQQGKINLKDDIFIEEGNVPFANGLGTSSKRPLTPVQNGALTSPVSVLATQFAAADAGNYFYKIVGLNRYGRSAPLAPAVIAVADGDEVNIPVTDGGQNTTAYIVYRSAKDAADNSECKEAFRVARTAANQTIVDLNAYLPGCSSAFGLTLKPDVLGWKQLAPFTKMPLATIDTSIRWMMVLYGALQVRKPRHNFVLRNVGRDPNSPMLASDLTLEGF